MALAKNSQNDVDSLGIALVSLIFISLGVNLALFLAKVFKELKSIIKRKFLQRMKVAKMRPEDKNVAEYKKQKRELRQ